MQKTATKGDTVKIKVSGLTRDQVRTLQDSFGTGPEFGFCVTTATTATFEAPSADDAYRSVESALWFRKQEGSSYRALYAVLRKIQRQMEALSSPERHHTEEDGR